MMCLQADLILLVGTENGTSEVTQAEYDTVWRMLNPPNLPVEAHPVRLSHSGHRMSAGDNSGSKMSSLELAGGGDTVHGACFTADSDDVRSYIAVTAQFLKPYFGAWQLLRYHATGLVLFTRILPKS